MMYMVQSVFEMKYGIGRFAKLRSVQKDCASRVIHPSQASLKAAKEKLMKKG